MSLFGSPPHSEIVPVSCPFVLFRNKDAYRFKTKYSKKTPRIPFVSKALNQTYYYKNALSDFPIPSDLLYEAILEDSIIDRNQYLSCSSYLHRNTLCSINMAERSFLCHVAGRLKDHLILRDSTECFASPDRWDMQGFTYQVGSEVHQLEKTCVSSWSNVSELIATTSNEILHFKLDDTEKYLNQKDHTRGVTVKATKGVVSRMHAVNLDPLQKWRLNTNIVTLNLSKYHFGVGAFINETNDIYDLNLTCGPQKIAQNIFPGNSSNGSGGAGQEGSVEVECTSHPKICLCSQNKTVYLFDSRSNSPANTLFSTPSTIQSLCTLSSSPQLFLLGHVNATLMIDQRFTKKCLAQRATADAQTILRAATNVSSCFKDSSEICFGASFDSAHIYLHTIDVNEFQEGNSFKYLRNCHTPFGSNDVSWDVSGFPRIGQNESFLSGVDTVAYQGDSTEGTLVYLCQQTEIGDIYAQKLAVQTTAEGDKSVCIQENLPIGVRTYPAESYNRLVTSAHLRHQRRPIVNAFGHGTGQSLCDTDALDNVYPISDFKLMPSIEDNELKRFAILRMNSRDMIMTPHHVYKNKNKLFPSVPAEKEDIIDCNACYETLEGLLNEIVDMLGKYSLTLWELWRFVVDKINCSIRVMHLKMWVSSVSILSLELLSLPDFNSLTSDGLEVDEGVSATEKVSSFECTCMSQLQEMRLSHPKDIVDRIPMCEKCNCPVPHCVIVRLKDSSVVKQTNVYIKSESKSHSQELNMSDVTSDIIYSLEQAWDDFCEI